MLQLESEPAADREPSPTVDIVVPVYNEAHVLAAHVRRLHAYLYERFPFSWRITIVDNASTDATWASARRLATELDRVVAMWDPLESTCRHASLSIL